MVKYVVERGNLFTEELYEVIENETGCEAEPAAIKPSS